jgi:rubrerythrin
MTVVVTRATGGTAKPVGVLYIEPEIQVTDAGAGTALATSDIDAAFTADLLSASLAHERCGTHLYRSAAARTTVDELRERYEQFGTETLEHVRLLEELVTGAGGDPQYVSPAARATEKAAAALLESSYLLAGSVDGATAELAMLEAVMLAETKDHANWELLAQLAAHMTDTGLSDQFEAVTTRVLAQEEEHYRWASDTRARMLFALATGGAAPSSTGAPRDPSTMTRDELYAAAQALGIEGRSKMSKDELAEAVADRKGTDR